MSFGFLLDTNVVSDPTQQRPEPRVELWLRAQPNRTLYISAITAGELRKGIALLDQGKRRVSLEQWLELLLLVTLFGRVLPVTQTIANRWGILTASRQLAGDPLSLADGLIAATALEENLTLVTRNTKHFANLGMNLLNPWNASPQLA